MSRPFHSSSSSTADGMKVAWTTVHANTQTRRHRVRVRVRDSVQKKDREKNI